MRLLLIFPLAFLAGMDGFILFVPYLLAIVAAGHVIALRRRAEAADRLLPDAVEAFGVPAVVPIA